MPNENLWMLGNYRQGVQSFASTWHASSASSLKGIERERYLPGESALSGRVVRLPRWTCSTYRLDTDPGRVLGLVIVRPGELKWRVEE